MELYRQFHTHSITEKELELLTVNIKKNINYIII